MLTGTRIPGTQAIAAFKPGLDYLLCKGVIIWTSALFYSLSREWVFR